VLPDALLACLQSSIRTALQLATDDPHIVNTAEVSSTIQQTILNALDVVLKTRDRGISAPPRSLARYKHLVDHIDFRLCQGPMTDLKCQELADEIGISVRTLQSAVNVVCGSGLHRYSRLRRLWSVRRQLRMGFPGLTVKASAWAHGFVHMSEFSDSYKKAFGELPSATLLNAQRRAVA
jgi:AraC family ethanolamine operon transcriptional activator